MAYEDELQKYFDGLSDELRAPLSDAIREQAELLSAAQRERLKELEQSPDETGHLEESCVVVPGENDLEFIVQAGGELTTKEIREGSGVEYDYAEGFEFGTARQPARPFFYNTYEEMKPDMQDAINEAIEKAIK